MSLFRPLKLETEFFEPQALGIALYIRDRLGLDPGLGGSPGCRIAPAIAPEEQLVTADRDDVSAQWSSWWANIFGAVVLRGVSGPLDYCSTNPRRAMSCSGPHRAHPAPSAEPLQGLNHASRSSQS
ncbi:hypothetical protein AB4Y95_14145 [Arthrobacter sp. M-10]|uniref:hypothetical protein n=1 Tax=Arthrobacter sp. M-10 TaxID=3233037 RepID=UPI003F93BE87